MTKVISISVTDQEKEWLELMDLSPTALIKQKISEMQVSTRSQRTRILVLEENVTKLQTRIALLYKFLEEKRLFEEFSTFEKNNVLEKEANK